MEIKEDIVIVGAGLAGLTTALALHRLGIRSLVVESSESLRTTGFALTLWSNAWRALDAVGIGDFLRQRSTLLSGYKLISQDKTLSFEDLMRGTTTINEVACRCVKRKELLETLEKELPQGSIRYSSRVVSIQESGHWKLLHLADGTLIKAKVLVGCDGVNSSVASWLGLQKPVASGRSAIRGYVEYPKGHGFEAKMHLYFDGGVRYGFLPCDDTSLYWFFTFPSSNFHDEEEMAQSPVQMKQYVLSKIEKGAPERVVNVVERTDLERVFYATLKLRLPWNVILGNIVKNNVCVAGDALHPMTPDLGQGGCSALEDSIVLARSLAEAISSKRDKNIRDGDEWGMERFVKQRRWRSFGLISVSYLVGLAQESDGKVMRFLREFLTAYTVRTQLKMADYDCGELNIS